jgi:hypothetical protein
MPARFFAVALGVQVSVPPVAGVADTVPLTTEPTVSLIAGPFWIIVAFRISVPEAA